MFRLPELLQLSCTGRQKSSCSKWRRSWYPYWCGLQVLNCFHAGPDSTGPLWVVFYLLQQSVVEIKAVVLRYFLLLMTLPWDIFVFLEAFSAPYIVITGRNNRLGPQRNHKPCFAPADIFISVCSGSAAPLAYCDRWNTKVNTEWRVFLSDPDGVGFPCSTGFPLSWSFFQSFLEYISMVVLWEKCGEIFCLWWRLPLRTIS